MDNNILVLDNETKFEPKGYKIINKSGLWLVHNNLKQVWLYKDFSISKFDIEDLKLSPKDQIYTVDFIEPERLYIYASRNNVPTGFLKSLKNNNNNTNCDITEFIQPQTLSFALDSLYSHRQILASVTPNMGSFYIVSKEGITLHDCNLRTPFSVIRPIRYCLNSGRFLYVSDGLKFIIFKFNEDLSVNKIIETVTSSFGHPCFFFDLSTSLILILLVEKGDKEQTIPDNSFRIQKITNDSRRIQSFPLAKQITIDKNISNYKFYYFDDAILSHDLETGSSHLFDFAEDNRCTLIGSEFKFNPRVNGIFNKKFAISGDSFFVIKQRYVNILSNSMHMTAALFRRTNGLEAALKMSKKRLGETRDTEKMKKFVNIIGPSASDPVSQMRFARVIQFSGFTDPHLILIGLLQYAFVLGEKMVDEARIPLLEAATHPSCINSIVNLLSCCKLGLNARALKILIAACAEKIYIDPDLADNLLDYAKVCIELKMKKEAKKMILRAELEGTYDESKIKSLKEMAENI